MKIIDNVLPKFMFNRLKEAAFKSDVAWCCTTTSYSEDLRNDASSFEDKDEYSFGHVILFERSVLSPMYPLAELCCAMALKEANIDFLNITRIRLGLILFNKDVKIHGPHVDRPDIHKTGLIYLNDNDGKTFIYNEKYVPCEIPTYEYYRDILQKKVSIKETIIPKQNRFCWFDGSHYHSSSTPTDVGRRIVINFNFI